VTEFCTWVDILDVITSAIFGDDRLRDRGKGSNFPFTYWLASSPLQHSRTTVPGLASVCSVLLIWPRKMCHPMQNNNNISWSYHCKFLFAISLLFYSSEWRQLLWIFSYVLLALSWCVLLQATRGLGLHLGLGVSASFNITEMCITLNCCWLERIGTLAPAVFCRSALTPTHQAYTCPNSCVDLPELSHNVTLFHQITRLLPSMSGRIYYLGQSTKTIKQISGNKN